MKNWLSKPYSKVILFVDCISTLYLITSLFFFIYTEAFHKVGYYIILIGLPVLSILRHVFPIDKFILNVFDYDHDELLLIFISIVMLILMAFSGVKMDEVSLRTYAIYFMLLLGATQLFIKKESRFATLYFAYAVPVFMFIGYNLHTARIKMSEDLNSDTSTKFLLIIFTLLLHTYITISAINYICYYKEVDDFYNKYIGRVNKKYAPLFSLDQVNKCSREVMKNLISANINETNGCCICHTGHDDLDFDFGVFAYDTPYGDGTYLINGHIDAGETTRTCFYLIDNKWEIIKVKVIYINHKPVYYFSHAGKNHEMTMEEFEKNFIGRITAFIPESIIFEREKNYSCISRYTAVDLYEESKDYIRLLRKAMFSQKD